MDYLNISIVGTAVVVVLVVAAIALFFSLRRPQKPPKQIASVELEQSLEPVTQESVSEITQKKEISFDAALIRTRDGFMGRIKNLFSGKTEISDEELELLEEILYTSDLGPHAVSRLMESVNESLQGQQKTLETIKLALKNEMQKIFSGVQSIDEWQVTDLKTETSGPSIWMIVGVNGAGKTTSIGKLAALLAQEGKKVLVAAGDTFRAAAGEQLKVWTERAQVEIFHPEGITDPSAVAFDACQKAKARGYDVVLVDTAGRLHTQRNLMDELIKMKRVIQKNIPSAPHEVLLVLDANNGQNALVQAREFHSALSVTGVILTKLDGTAKGGVALGVASELTIPVKLVGLGERIEDLRGFSVTQYIDSILS